MNGVAGVGAYAPRARVSAEAFAEAWGRFKGSGISTKAVPEADEDSLTMAYEAATRAVDAAAVDAADVRHLAVGTTTPPMAEEDFTPRLGGMLGIPRAATRELLGHSTAAGMEAFLAAARAEGPALAVASDAPRGSPDSAFEHAAGAGAVAVVFESDAPGEVVDTGSAASPYPGTRFRRSGSEELEGLDVTTYDRAAFTETVGAAAADVAYDPADLDAVAVQSPDGRLPYRVAGTLGVDTNQIQTCATVHDLGDTGAASPLLSLSAALAADASTVLCVGYGSGATADAVLVRDGGVPVEIDIDAGPELSYAAYLRRRGDITSGEPAGGGAYISVPSWRRSLAQRYRLEAGRCEACGALNFLPEGACKTCHELTEYDPIQLSREGTVEAVSVISQGGAPPEFAEQQARQGDYATGIVAFDGPDSGSASAPALVVDADAESVAVGDRVVATIRRIYEQEGVVRYGCKVRPVQD